MYVAKKNLQISVLRTFRDNSITQYKITFFIINFSFWPHNSLLSSSSHNILSIVSSSSQKAIQYVPCYLYVHIIIKDAIKLSIFIRNYVPYERIPMHKYTCTHAHNYYLMYVLRT